MSEEADARMMDGPWRFALRRDTGGHATTVVAEGCLFRDGHCALRWRSEHASSVWYPRLDSLLHVHHVNEGTTTIEWLDERPSDVFLRATHDCYQDYCENVPFASVGGPDARERLDVPKYIKADEADEYVRGYAAMARRLYGADWRTCKFGWQPALTIGGR